MKALSGKVKEVYREVPVEPQSNKDPSPLIAVADFRFPPPKVHGIDENLFGENSEHFVKGFHYGKVEPIRIEDIGSSSSEEVADDEPFVPVILSPMIQTLFNLFVAQDENLKKFREIVDIQQEGKPGAPFYIVLERKPPGGQAETRVYRCRVVGNDSTVSQFAIAVPFEYAQEWNEFLGSSPHFERIILEARTTSALEDVSTMVTDAGFKPAATDAQKISIIVSRGSFYLLIVAVAFCLVIAVVSAIGIFNGLSISVIEQARRIGILRSVGASRKDIVTIYLFEAAFIGVLGAAIGIIASHLIMWGCNIGVKEYVEGVTGLHIQTLFIGSTTAAVLIAFGAFAMSLLSSLLSGVVPAYRASRLDPVVVLREG
jgi:hypothetical protein